MTHVLRPARSRALALIALTILLALAGATGCSDDASIDDTAMTEGPAFVDVIPDINDSGMVDSADGELASEASCTVLFGVPNEKTGLSDEQCAPICDCEGRRFEPPAYTASDIAAIEALVHSAPMAPLTEDPYVDPAPTSPEGSVCAVLLDPAAPGTYTTQTFASRDEALATGATPSHSSACGLCSPLVNLAVYMRQPDLTDPVRACGIQGMSGTKEDHMACLMALGFDEACASIWYYNTKHTQTKCTAVCMAALNDPYHLPDGSLNACMICDEVEAGPVFKAFAGRTRRNTGLPSSMCRPCAEVLPFIHHYE